MSGFIFDMDGVLLDSMQAWQQSEQWILDSARQDLTKEQRDQLNALTLSEVGDWFRKELGIGDDDVDFAQVVMDRMLGFYRDEVQAKAGAYDFVKAVHDAGAPMCVLSSSPQAFLQAGLGRAGLKRFFAEGLIISADETGLTKRSLSTFQQVCEMLGTQPGETWLFDDSWYALRTAREAGLRCAGVYSSEECATHDELALHADVVADDFSAFDVRDFL